MSEFRVACLQTCTGTTPKDNLTALTSLIKEAAQEGAEFILTPETCNFMPQNKEARCSTMQSENDDKMVASFAALAADLKITLLAGSFILSGDSDKAVNRSICFNPLGDIVARYDKIHLFDVALDNGERHSESAHYEAGQEAVIADLSFGKLGMTVCYDVRFPALFRSLAMHGADFISVPAAFTKMTGEAHWHVLLRARAIETGCFIFAPAQSGTHENGRKTYGHSVIVSPWGRVLADAGLETQIIYADIDTDQVQMARRQIPALEHGRHFEPPV